MDLRLNYISAPIILLCLFFICSSEADCPFPKRPLRHGRFVYKKKEDRNLENAPEHYVLSFRCNKNYVLEGPKQILCWSTRWTHNIPKCTKISCPAPRIVKNSQYKIYPGESSQPEIGSTVEYFCNNGYEMAIPGVNKLNCTLAGNKGVWAGEEIPSCIKKEACPNPGGSLDGQRTGPDLFVGSVLTFTCNERFQLEGSDTIQCLPGGNWSAPRPLCRPEGDHCDFPPAIPHGDITGDKTGDFYLPYDQVEISCESGYAYSGASIYNMCEDGRQWEEEFKECTEVYCERPTLIENGTIPELENLNITTFPYKFEVTYTCDKGFKLIGDSWRICKEKGWSGKTPHCEVIRCPDPGVPEYGTRLVNMKNFEVGSKVIFTCFPGYNLIGSFERYCMPNGQWSGELARCDHESNYCPDPGIPINGVKNSSSYDMGDKIGFRCLAGNHLIGSETRTCLKDRTWSGTEAKCRGPYEYDNRDKVSNILIQAIDEKKSDLENIKDDDDNNTFTAEGKILDLNFPGRLILYFAFDVSGSVGENNFIISKEFAKAIVKKIGISAKGGRAGALTFSSKAKEEFSPLLYTTTEDVIEALDNIKYTGGGTSASDALALIRKQMMPLTQGHIEKNGQKSVIFILTDGKANMGGNPEQEADLLKQAGVEIYCIGITNSYSEDSLYRIASENEAGSKEEHVFILQNYPIMTWLVQKITNGTIDYSPCGLEMDGMGSQNYHSKVVGGKVSTRHWPWMAALYFKRDHEHEYKISCGGSVIDKNFILTAAHCLYDGNNNRRKEHNIKVQLGLKNTDNKTTMEEYEVAKYYHPRRYKHQYSFDYDIALLQLKRPIKFSPFIRPICLPPAIALENSTLYQPGQFAVATGWGHDSKLEQNYQDRDTKMVKDLKEISLPIQSRETCLPVIKDRYKNSKIPIEQSFTERIVCAGYEHGGNDTCKGDSGGPLMQSQQSENNVYWTQVGIISFGFGCALPRAYGYYTHVQKLLTWVQTILNAHKT